MDKTKVKKYKLGEEPSDLKYWLSQSPYERIKALEEIIKEYNTWKYGTEQRFQRVYRIIKLQDK